MNTRTEDAGRQPALLRGMAWLADLDHPFYAEERKRDVWNEASAVALTLTAALGLSAVGIVLLAGGLGAMPYAGVLLAAVAVPALIAQVYARMLGVSALASGWTRRTVTVMAVPAVVLAAGLIRVGLDRDAENGSAWWGTAVGGVLGAAIGGVAMTAVVRRARQREHADNLSED